MELMFYGHAWPIEQKCNGEAASQDWLKTRTVGRGATQIAVRRQFRAGALNED
jgi:hypothetical protein